MLFECIGGEITAPILRAMPEESECIFYGVLSEQKLGQADFADLLFTRKTIRGFYMGKWLQEASMWTQF